MIKTADVGVGANGRQIIANNFFWITRSGKTIMR
jgi:hypothetical protein